MRRDIEELTEDAFASYLRTQVTGDMRIYTAWQMNKPQYPCAIVHVGETEPISAEASHHDARYLKVEISVGVEAAKTVTETIRENNARFRSDVKDAIDSSGLLAAIQAQGIEAVAFSMAEYAMERRETQGRVLVTILEVLVISEPVTGT